MFYIILKKNKRSSFIIKIYKTFELFTNRNKNKFLIK